MPAKKKFKSDVFEAIHSSASSLLKVGAIDKDGMKSFDEICFINPEEINPEKIRKIRECNRVSQSVFARFLNTSESTVQKWETGAKRPSGMARKLLSVVDKHGLKILA